MNKAKTDEEKKLVRSLMEIDPMMKKTLEMKKNVENTKKSTSTSSSDESVTVEQELDTSSSNINKKSEKGKEISPDPKKIY